MAKKPAAPKAKPVAKGKPAPKAKTPAKPAAKAKAPAAAKPTAPPPAATKPAVAAKPTGKVKPIPDGYHTITPYLIVRGTAHAIEFYRRAFGAEEIYRMPGVDGFSIMHAEVKIGDSFVMLTDENMAMNCKAPPTLGGSSSALFLYLTDVDAAYQRAVDAGATPRMPPTDMFWGDRFAKVVDPFGHEWSLATHKEDLTPAEIGKRAQAFFGAKFNEPHAD